MKTSKTIYISFVLASFLSFMYYSGKCFSQTHSLYPKNNEQNVVPQKGEDKVIALISKKDSLLNLFNIVPNLRTQWYYASVNNFTGHILYKNPKPLLVRPAALALKSVADSLQKSGLGLTIFDAYRPHSVSVKMWKIVNNPDYVADPSKGSNHNRGTAVDLTLYDLKTGRNLEMPSAFDDFSEKAHHDYMKLPQKIIRNRALLKNIMEHFGFKAYKNEWWHYTFVTDIKYELLDIDFSEF